LVREIINFLFAIITSVFFPVCTCIASTKQKTGVCLKEKKKNNQYESIPPYPIISLPTPEKKQTRSRTSMIRKKSDLKRKK